MHTLLLLLACRSLFAAPDAVVYVIICADNFDHHYHLPTTTTRTEREREMTQRGCVWLLVVSGGGATIVTKEEPRQQVDQ